MLCYIILYVMICYDILCYFMLWYFNFKFLCHVKSYLYYVMKLTHGVDMIIISDNMSHYLHWFLWYHFRGWTAAQHVIFGGNNLGTEDRKSALFCGIPECCYSLSGGISLLVTESIDRPPTRQQHPLKWKIWNH